MSQLNSIIVEDEPNSVRFLEKMIEMYAPDLTVVGNADSVESAISLINDKKPNVVFLDIEIIGGTGFDILKSFEKPSFKVIFTTGYDEYAIRAFKFNAVDYLLKPINKDEFLHAVEQVKTLHNQTIALQELAADDIKKTPDHIIISDRQGATRLNLSDIVIIKASGAYSEFYPSNSKKIIASKSIGYFEEFLPTLDFVRLHHGAIVNLKHIISYDSATERVLLSNEMRQEISSRKKKEFMEKFKK